MNFTFLSVLATSHNVLPSYKASNKQSFGTLAIYHILPPDVKLFTLLVLEEQHSDGLMTLQLLYMKGVCNLRYFWLVCRCIDH